MTALATLDKREVDRFARDFEDLFYRGDSAAMASYYAVDAKLMAQDEEIIEGRPAIERFFRTTCEVERTIDVQEVEASCGLGYVRGVVTLRIPAAEGQATKITFKYVTLWRREAEGGWRLLVDISNRNAPLKT